MADSPEEQQKPKPADLDQNRRPARKVGRRLYVDRVMESEDGPTEPRERRPGRYVTK